MPVSPCCVVKEVRSADSEMVLQGTKETEKQGQYASLTVLGEDPSRSGEWPRSNQNAAGPSAKMILRRNVIIRGRPTIKYRECIANLYGHGI